MIPQNQVSEVSNRIIATLESVYRKLKSDSKFQKIVDELDNFYNEYGGVTRCEFVLDDDDLYHSQYYGDKEGKTYTGDLYLVDNAEDVGRIYLEGSCEKVKYTDDGCEAYFAIGRNMNKRKALYTDFKDEMAVTSKVYAYMAKVLKDEARKQKLNLKPSKKDVGFGGNNAFVFEISLGKTVKMEDTIQSIRQGRLEKILEKYRADANSDDLIEKMNGEVRDGLISIIDYVYTKLKSNPQFKELLNKVVEAYKIAEGDADFWNKEKINIIKRKPKPQYGNHFEYNISIDFKSLGTKMFGIDSSIFGEGGLSSIRIENNLKRDLSSLVIRNGIKNVDVESLNSQIVGFIKKTIEEGGRNAKKVVLSSPKEFRNDYIEYGLRHEGYKIY